MEEQVKGIFEQWAGCEVERIEALPLSGSARHYYRLWGEGKRCIGVYHED